MNREYDYWYVVFARKRNCCSVHDGKIFTHHAFMAQPLITHGIGILARIGRIDAIHLRSLEQGVCANFCCPQGCCGISGEERITGSTRKDHDLALVHIGGCLTLRKTLAQFWHGDGGKNDGLDTKLDERRAQRQRVDDGREHPHVIAADAMPSASSHRHAAEDIAPTDIDADFDAHFAHTGDVPGDLVNDIDVDAETLFSHQRLAGGLEYDATISGCLIHAHLLGHSRARKHHQRGANAAVTKPGQTDHWGALLPSACRRQSTAAIIVAYTKGTALSRGALQLLSLKSGPRPCSDLQAHAWISSSLRQQLLRRSPSFPSRCLRQGRNAGTRRSGPGRQCPSRLPSGQPRRSGPD